MDHAQLTGLVLSTGSLCFLIGAGLVPEPRKLFAVELKEHLALLHRSRARWHAMNSLMIAAMIGTAVGLFLLSADIAGSMRALGAAVAYLIGAVLWIVALSFRDTAVLDAAEAADTTGEIPGWLEPMQNWTGRMFWLHMALSYVAIALLGWTLVATDFLAAGVGWFALVYGTLLGSLFVAGTPKVSWGPVTEPPFLVHIPLLVIGIALLVR